MIYYWLSSNKNIGDAITPFLLNKLGYDCKFDQSAKFIGAGSILGFSDVLQKSPIVWGSGFLNETDKIPKIQRENILALRGKLTAKKLKIDSCVLGDPGLLISRYYKNTAIEKKYKYGIISHCTDFNIFSKIKNFNGIVLNAQFDKQLTEQDITKFINRLNECEFILSSSLHGLIFAHAYNIPAIYLKNEQNMCRFDSHVISQKDFKFRDYYSSLDTDFIYTVFDQDFTKIDLSMLSTDSKPSVQCVETIQNNLINSLAAITNKQTLIKKEQTSYLYF